MSGCLGGCAGCWALSFQEGRWERGQPRWEGAMEATAHSRASSEAALCLGCSRGWRLHSISEHPAPLLTCPHPEKLFPYTQPDFFFQLKAMLPITKLV